MNFPEMQEVQVAELPEQDLQLVLQGEQLVEFTKNPTVVQLSHVPFE